MADNLIVTKTARKKLVLARAGKRTLPIIVGMAFGNGGVDASGNVIEPSETQTELNSELIRKVVSSATEIENEVATVRYECTLEASDIPGAFISELGLYDQDGDLVCIKNFRKKGKDSDLEMTFTIDDVF